LGYNDLTQTNQREQQMKHVTEYQIINTTSGLYYSELFGWHPTDAKHFDSPYTAFHTIENNKLQNCAVKRTVSLKSDFVDIL